MPRALSVNANEGEWRVIASGERGSALISLSHFQIVFPHPLFSSSGAQRRSSTKIHFLILICFCN